MNYECYDMSSYNLHCIKTNKFKTITVEIDFLRKINKDEITIRNLLKMVLLNSTKNYNTDKKLIIKSEELFDIKIFSSNNTFGNYTNLAFKARFLNEKYTEKGMNSESIAFLLDIILNPNIKDNSFDDEIVELCKKNLKKVILSRKDNKPSYALRKLLDSTENMPYSSDSKIEDLDKINGKNLYDYYKTIFTNELIDIFIIGDIDNIQIKDIFKNNLKLEVFKRKEKYIPVSELKIRKRIKKLSLKDNANQTIFTLLCSLNNMTDYERKYVLRVYAEMLGGSANSILFENIREKKSYAYYINALEKPYDNIMVIYSGVEKKNIDNVLKIVRKNLKDISSGRFREDQFNNAKNNLISSLEATLDNPNSIINTFYATALVNSDNIETRIEKMKKVTKEEIINFSKKVNINTLFVLEGDSNEEN